MLETSADPRSGRSPGVWASTRSADRADVLGSGAAAAADDPDAVSLDELAEGRGEWPRLLGEDRLPVGPLQRQARVGDAVDRQRRALAQVADRVPHVLRAGGAVEPDHLDVQGRQRGQHRLDVGAEQHLAALRQQRDRGLDREGPARELERLSRPEDRRLHLQDVLRGLDDDQVGAALDQALRLLGEDLDQLSEGDVPQGGVVARRQEAGRADRAGDEAVRARRLAGDLRGPAVDLRRVLAEPPFVELQPAALEGVGLDHLGARLEHRGVDALDHVGPVEDERLVALALQTAVVLLRQVELLEGRAHAAVEDDDTLAHRPQVVALRHGGEG